MECSVCPLGDFPEWLPVWSGPVCGLTPYEKAAASTLAENRPTPVAACCGRVNGQWKCQHVCEARGKNWRLAGAARGAHVFTRPAASSAGAGQPRLPPPRGLSLALEHSVGQCALAASRKGLGAPCVDNGPREPQKSNAGLPALALVP